MAHIVIIGNGIAGSTAARHIRKNSDHEITMISDESAFPFSRTALMYIFMGHLKFENTKLYEDWFWSKNRINTIVGKVKLIDIGTKTMIMENNVALHYDKLIIATGSESKTLGSKYQDLKGIQGLYHLQDLEKMEANISGNIQRAVILGGGLIGVEMAEMLHSRNIPVTMLVREKSYSDTVLPPEESNMVNREILANGIDLRLDVSLDEILEENGSVAGVKYIDSNEIISCQFLALTVGVSPNIGVLQNSGIQSNRGILVNEYLQTSEKDVYAIGDCAELISPNPGRKSIETLWYTARIMGETIAQTICGTPTPYDPGIWFNSAKFFNLEYQVYGDIPARTPDHIASLFWEHPNENKSIRINYDASTGVVTGFNLMGIRYRHKVCEKWISETTHIEIVLKNLSLANFDPEFFKHYEGELLRLYHQKFQKRLI